MNLFTQKEACCGCGACAAVCPRDAISMVRDREGFDYPQVDAGLCVECGRCQTVCPVKNPGGESCHNTYLGARAKADAVRFGSSSGGMFPLLAGPVLERGGAVWGAAFDQDMAVVHREALNLESLDALKRTKYVQSRMDRAFVRIRNRLEQGQWVLFCGTPCQARALQLFLSKGYPTLLLVDLVCHGTPSPGMWESYIKYLQRRYGPLESFSFRDKRARDSGHTRAFVAGGQEHSAPLSQDLYIWPFLTGCTIRPSCHSCKFCTPQRQTDFTIGDFWGVEKVRPQADDGMGISIMILHNDRAREYWRLVEGQTDCFSCTREEILQPRLQGPAPVGYRNAFMAAYQTLGFLSAAKLYHAAIGTFRAVKNLLGR